MKQLILLSLLFLYASQSKGQDWRFLDSLDQQMEGMSDTSKVMEYQKAYKQIFQNDLKTSRVLAERGLKFAQASAQMSLIALSENIMGVQYLQVASYDTAIIYFRSAKEKYQEFNNNERVLQCSNNMAIAYEKLGQLEEALALHLEAVKIQEGSGVSGGDLLASNYWNLGNVYLNLKQESEAIKNFEKALRIYEEMDEEIYQIDLKHQLALAYSNLDSFAISNKLFLEAIDYYKQKGMVDALAGAYDNIGSNYINLKNFEHAEEYLLKALKMSLESEVQDLSGQIYRRLSLLYFDQKKLNKAEGYAKSSLQNAQSFGRLKKEITDHQVLSKIYEGQNRYQLALDHYKSFHAINDSIYGLEQLNTIHEMQLEFEREKKAQEIQLIEQQAEQKRMKKNAMIFGLLLVSMLLGILAYSFRIRAEAQKIAKEKSEQELDFSQRELEQKKKELTAFTLQLANKNEILNLIKEDVEDLEMQTSQKRPQQKIINTINRTQQDEASWEVFQSQFLALHKDFDKNIKARFPKVTSNDLRLISLIKMNLGNKQIANLLNISSEGIKKARYRLRKKLDLASTDSLEEFILSL